LKHNTFLIMTLFSLFCCYYRVNRYHTMVILLQTSQW